MKKIGFDFDGVIAEKVSFDGDIKKYRKNLLKAKPLLNLDKIIRLDDRTYIITGRYKENYFYTIKWLNQHYPKFNPTSLYFVNTLTLKNDFCNRSHLNYLKFILYVSRMKLKKIAELDLDIYYEDNEITIRYLRFFIGRKCKIIDIKDVILENNKDINLDDDKIRNKMGMKKIQNLYCARCGKILHPYDYIKNLKHAIILNKEHLLSFCDNCIEKSEKERK